MSGICTWGKTVLREVSSLSKTSSVMIGLVSFSMKANYWLSNAIGAAWKDYYTRVSDYVTFPRNLPHVRKPYTTTFYQLIQCFNFNFDPTNDHNLLWFLDTHSLICHFIRKRDAPGEPRNADGKRTRYDPNVSSFCFYGVYLMGMKKKIVLQYFV